MEFLKNATRFSFLYNGKPWDTCPHTKEISVTENEVISTYLFDGGLKLTNVAKSTTATERTNG